jgi:hypothetical protein
VAARPVQILSFYVFGWAIVLGTALVSARSGASSLLYWLNLSSNPEGLFWFGILIWTVYTIPCALAYLAWFYNERLVAWFKRPEMDNTAGVSGRRTENGRLRAEGLEIFDNTGKLRALLGCSTDGVASLSFYNENGLARLVAGIGADGTAGVAIRDSHAQQRFGITADHSGTPKLTLRDQAGRYRAILALADNTSVPNLTLYDESGRAVWGGSGEPGR